MFQKYYKVCIGRAAVNVFEAFTQLNNVLCKGSNFYLPRDG